MSSVTATCWQIQVCRTENHSWQGAYLPTVVLNCICRTISFISGEVEAL